jgi:large subunit ribosomal protein L30
MFLQHHFRCVCDELEDVLLVAGPGTRAFAFLVMSFARAPTRSLRTLTLASRRALATEASSSASPPAAPPPAPSASLAGTPPADLAAAPDADAASSPDSLTHFRVTLRRSAISLPAKFKGTLAALGLRRRHQTVYHAHTPEAAGMVLRVKELVEVSNVRAADVRSAAEQKQERKASRGYVKEGTALGAKF